MTNTYDMNTMAVMICLTEDGYSKKTIAEHYRCYEALQEHLAETDSDYSIDAAVKWLSIRKIEWSADTYERYRRAVYRLDKYVNHRSISRDETCSNYYFAYSDTGVSYINLPENYKLLYHEFHAMITKIRSKGTAEHYAAACTGFLLFLSKKGCYNPENITVEDLLEYLKIIRNNKRSEDTNAKHATGVSWVLKYFAEMGYVPKCYYYVFSKPHIENMIMSMTLRPELCGTRTGKSKNTKYNHHIDGFLLKLEDLRYHSQPKDMFGSIIKWFFLFLEVNNLVYSQETINLWLGRIPKGTLWNTKRMTMKWFADYVLTGSIEKDKNYVWRPLLSDALPNWSRSIIDDYLEERKKEGLANSTLRMCRSSCTRFFSFLDSKGILNTNEITPDLVKEFHVKDIHSTTEGKNAYAIRIRRLLIFMGERELVPPGIHLAVPTRYAPVRRIVSIMSPEMEKAIYQYKENAESALELRRIAMVMLGYKMGLRASDVVNLRFENVDWKNDVVSIKQCKTGKPLALPLPANVGNCIYNYVSNGRPTSGESGAGYVFVHHKAPYSKLSVNMCADALRRVLVANGIELPHGQGFHITRRTFATNLLVSRVKINSIADALGHDSPETLGRYLSNDEDGMRQCPLSFSGLGV